MSNFSFLPSLEQQFTKAPAIAIAGPSGCGKTESAMRLARGYCGPGVPFALIDTEEKRALYKQQRYQPWDWLDFQPPYSPERCVEVLQAAAKYRAVILDSGSAEYDEEGGIAEIAEEELERLAKGDPARMEALVAPSWKKAKMRHKRVFMAYLRRYPTLLIICLRAEPKVKFMKEKFTRQNGSVGEKTVIVDAGYQPICEKLFMYDMLVGCKMTPGEAGIPEHIKKLEKELEPIFLDGKQIDESTGERLAVWTHLRASGAKPAESAPRPSSESSARADIQSVDSEPDGVAGLITPDQVIALADLCAEAKLDKGVICKKEQITSLALLPASEYGSWVESLRTRIEQRRAAI